MAETFTFKNCRQKKRKLNRTHLMTLSTSDTRKQISKGISFQTYENAITKDGFQRKRVRKIFVATTDRLQYSGTNFESATHDGDRPNFFIGCFKRSTNEMKVYPADTFRCTPVFENKLPTTCIDDQEKYSEKADNLTEAFGSKHKKQAMKSRIKHKVGDTAIPDAVIEALEDSYAAMKTIEVNNSSIVNNTSSDVCPPRNNNATAEDQVYNVFDIISDIEYAEIEPQAQVLVHATTAELDSWENEKLYASFVIRYLKDNLGFVSLSKAKFLAYYDYIIKFSKLRYNDLRRKDIAPEIPNPFKDMLTQKFVMISVGPKGLPHKAMPPKMKDKLFAYSLVLALLIADFTLEPTEFLSDCKITLQKMSKIAYAVGCHMLTRKTNNVQSKVAVLKLPLYIPKEKFYGGKTK